MDYFSVIVLIIVVFIFISDRKIKNIDTILGVDEEIFIKIEELKQNLKIINLKSKDMHYNKIKKILNEQNEEYLLIKNSNINLNKQNIDTIVANYIICGKRPCGFNLLYSYETKKLSLKRIYVDIVNYLNIFNKQELDTYAIMIVKKTDFQNNEKRFRQNIVSYTPTEFTNVVISDEYMKGNNFKRIYIAKINNSNKQIIFKLLLLIISGSFITSNLIYSILNIDNNLTNLIVSIVIYCCYSYIIRYVYSPIGKQRVLASYIFPIYFLSYIFISIYMVVAKVIKKVQAS